MRNYSESLAYLASLGYRPYHASGVLAMAEACGTFTDNGITVIYRGSYGYRIMTD